MKKNTLLAAMLLSFPSIMHSQCNDVAPPYLENFDTTLPPDLPDCTYSYKQTFVGNEWETVAAPNNNFTGNVGQYSTYSDVGWSMYCDFIMRPLELTAGMAYKVSYKYAHNDNDTAIDALRVLLSSNSQPSTELASHLQVTGTAVVSTSSELFTVPATGNYYLRFSIESGGNQGILYLDDIKIEEMGVMSTNDTKLLQISCYPNPVKDKLTIINTTGNETIELYNTAGQLLLRQPANDVSTAISFENISGGIYFLKTTSHQATKTVQLIKE